MLHNTDFYQLVFEKGNYPPEARDAFTRILKRLDDEPEFGAKVDRLVEDYLFPVPEELHTALDGMTALGQEYGENEYTMHFIFILLCLPATKERYAKAGMPEELFWAGVDDFRCKLIECIKCKEVPGTFVAGWNHGFFKLSRFAIGRFQFETSTYGSDTPFTMKCGHVVEKGDLYINFHIPSSGIPLTDEVRLESYKKAYDYFKYSFEDGRVLFGCGSWLLYPGHREFLPGHLNILRFMNDFELVAFADKDTFGNDWRVFDKYASLPYEQLPEDTSLRKAYKQRLMSGGKTGDGFGLFLFDGKKIVR